MLKVLRFLLSIAIVSIALAACGSDDPDPTPTPTMMPTATDTPMPAATATPAATFTPTFTPTPVPPPQTDVSGQRIGLGHIYDLDLSPDGSLIVAGGAYRIWIKVTSDLSSDPAIIDLGTDVAADVTFSPDGSLFAAGLDSGSILVWDTVTRELLHTLEGVHKRWANHLTISPDNQRIASVLQQPRSFRFEPLHVVDIASGETVFSLDEVMVRDLAFSPDGTLLAAVEGQTDVVLWDAATGEEVHRTQIVDDIGDSALAFSADGAQLFVHHDKRVLAALDVENPGGLVNFANDDEFVITPVQGMAYAGDSIFVAGDEGSVTRFDVASNTSTERLTLVDDSEYGWVMGEIDVGDNVLMIFVSAGENILLYDLEADAEIGMFTMSAPGVAEVVIDSTGTYLLVHHKVGGTVSNTGGNGLLWDISGDSPVLLARYNSVLAPRFSAAGSVFGITRDENDRPALVNLSAGETLIGGTSDYGTYYVYNPDVGLLANRSNERGTYVYDYMTGEYVQEFATEGVDELALSPNAAYLAQIHDLTLNIWEIDTGESVFEQTFGHLEEAIVLTDTGFWILAGDDRDNVHLLGYGFGSDTPVVDLAIGRTRGELAISPDESLGVIATQQTMLQIYDLASGELVQELLNDFVITDFTFMPDGTRLAIGDGSGEVTLVPLQTL